PAGTRPARAGRRWRSASRPWRARGPPTGRGAAGAISVASPSQEPRESWPTARTELGRAGTSRGSIGRGAIKDHRPTGPSGPASRLRGRRHDRPDAVTECQGVHLAEAILLGPELDVAV